jgi:regulator of protease activity HflC (stomatin/prohibitin superfamily)
MDKIWLFGLLSLVWLFAQAKVWYDARVIIDQTHEALVEVFKEYVFSFDTGFHFLFPYFNITGIHQGIQYYKGETTIKLFVSNGNTLIEFTDISAGLAAILRFKITSTVKAVYNVDNYLEKTIEFVESRLRSELGKLSSEEANASKGVFSLDHIFSQIEIDQFELDTGIRLVSILVSDIIFSTEQQLRRESLAVAIAERKKAEEDLLTADFQNKKVIKQKETEAEGICLLASARAEEIRLLAIARAKEIVALEEATGHGIKMMLDSSQLTKEEYITYLALKSIKETDKLIFGNGSASLGAEIAFGAGIVKKD